MRFMGTLVLFAARVATEENCASVLKALAANPHRNYNDVEFIRSPKKQNKQQNYY